METNTPNDEPTSPDHPPEDAPPSGRPPETLTPEDRKSIAQVIGGRLDQALDLIARVPGPVWVVLALAAVVGVFPFTMPADTSITGAALDSPVVVWAVRVAFLAAVVVVLGAAFFALRSIAIFIETGRWVKAAAGVTVDEAVKQVEELTERAESAERQIETLAGRLRTTEEHRDRLYELLESREKTVAELNRELGRRDSG